MHFEPLPLPGALRVRLERHDDERGFFARTACLREFRAHGLPQQWVQSSISWNRRRGTVRGLHFQWPPSQEAKLVRCVRGAIFDVLLDLRPGTESFLRHHALELDDERRDAVYVPAGVAHGFQTLRDDVEVLYQMSDYYVPELAAGVRWNDPALAIAWPLTSDLTIATRDAGYADFERAAFVAELARREAAGAPP